MVIEDELEPFALAGIAVQLCISDFDLLKGGRDGDMFFVIHNDDMEICEKSMKDVSENKARSLMYTSKWKNPIAREIESICAQHRADFMSLATTGTDFDKVKCFEWKDHTVQTAIWDLETLEMDSQWASLDSKRKEKSYPCVPAENTSPDLAKGLWLMDTGCGQDLINESMLEGYTTSNLDHPVTFLTANGKVKVHKTVPMYSKAMGGHMTPFLLTDTPPVLSVGRRCMEQGYSFHWDAYEEPYLVTPQGGCIALAVEQNIPYLDNRKGEHSVQDCSRTDEILAAAAYQIVRWHVVGSKITRQIFPKCLF